MAGDADKNQANWFAEFKKVSKGAPVQGGKPDATPEGSRKPSERRRHGRFEVDEAKATLTAHGILSVFGVGKANRARAALDLSEGGARFMLQERLAIGTKVHM